MILCKVAIRGDDMVYFEVPDEATAIEFIRSVEEALNLGQSITFNANNGKVVVAHQYLIRASYSVQR